MLKNWALCFISIIVTLILLEFLVRVISPQTTFADIAPHYIFGCFTKGDYYWIDLIPNRQCTFSSAINAFPQHSVALNSLGLRNPEITLPKPADATRIIFIGDSFVFGLGVENKDTLARLAETNLRQRLNRSIETINAGLPASGPSYYYLYLKNEALKLQPDIVIIGFYLRNDIVENILHSNWDKIDHQGLPEKTTSSIYHVDPTGDIYPSPLPLKYRLPGLRSSHLFVAISDHLPFGSHSFKVQQLTAARICFYKSSCKSLDDAKAKTRQLFLAIKQLTDQHQQQLLIVFIPSRVQFKENVDFVQTGIPIPLSPQEKNYPYQEFSDFFTANNIDYLDLRDYFLPKDPLTAYYSTDPHWNPRGHELAAQAVSSFLINHYFK